MAKQFSTQRASENILEVIEAELERPLLSLEQCRVEFLEYEDSISVNSESDGDEEYDSQPSPFPAFQLIPAETIWKSKHGKIEWSSIPSHMACLRYGC